MIKEVRPEIIFTLEGSDLIVEITGTVLLSALLINYCVDGISESP